MTGRSIGLELIFSVIRFTLLLDRVGVHWCLDQFAGAVRGAPNVGCLRNPRQLKPR
jgi:hypothetical protein